MIIAYAALEAGQTKSNCYAYHKYTQSCHKANILVDSPNYSKKKSTYGTGHYGVDPKNIQGGKKILSLKKKYVCYAPPVP
jgi:hypothetical protein